MKKTNRKVIAVVLTTILTAFSLAGCGAPGAEDAPPEKTAETSTTVTVADTNIIIGLTKLSELKEQGYTLSRDKKLTEPIPEEEIMEGMTYDVGIYFGKEDKVYGTVKCLNDKTESIPYIDSIINNVAVNFAENIDPYGLPFYTESILVDTVDFKGMTAEQLQEALKGTTEKEPSLTNFPDETVAFLSFSRNNCYFNFGFDMQTHLLSTLEVEMFHSKFE